MTPRLGAWVSEHGGPITGLAKEGKSRFSRKNEFGANCLRCT